MTKGCKEYFEESKELMLVHSEAGNSLLIDFNYHPSDCFPRDVLQPDIEYQDLRPAENVIEG